jgi:hypothetical protein
LYYANINDKKAALKGGFYKQKSEKHSHAGAVALASGAEVPPEEDFGG